MKFAEIKNFKNNDDYVAFRNEMLDNAEALLNDGKMEEYKALVEDVKTLENEYKEFAESKANLDALKNAAQVRNVVANKVETLNLVDDAESKYRKAFMNYVVKGEEIPADLKNLAEYTTTSDVGAVIPESIMNKIIEKINTAGNILAKVTRTNFKGGVVVPVSTARPVATWTTERGSTDSQKMDLNKDASVTFSYHKLRCVVAVGITSSVVTIDAFEELVAKNVAEALIIALEASIINGTGTNQPKGILAETPANGQIVEIEEGKHITYADVCAMEAALPLGYDAEWVMTKKTYISEIAGMVDDNGQPVARVNFGIGGKPEYTILGRPVNLTAHMEDFATTVTKDTPVAILFNFADYMINTNMQPTIKKYVDEDTDDQMTKAIMIADGKVVDKTSLVEMVVKNA